MRLLVVMRCADHAATVDMPVLLNGACCAAQVVTAPEQADFILAHGTQARPLAPLPRRVMDSGFGPPAPWRLSCVDVWGCDA